MNEIPKSPQSSQNDLPNKPQNQDESQKMAARIFWTNLLTIWFVAIVVLTLIGGQVQDVPYSTFISNLNQNKIERITVSEHRITGTLKVPKGQRFVTTRVDPELAKALVEHNVTFEGGSEGFWNTMVSWLLPALLIVFAWTYLMSRGKDSLTGAVSIVRNRAKIYAETETKVSFADAAGVDEAKEELQEVINFLKEPSRYARLGGHLPKGILLVGPPGTGKTLLARAVAGEAGVPFFSISGSEFVELYVGVGAARVRDLFAQAQQKAPCIIFIDELDALGRARGLNPTSGAHDEKEQTLNQLLVELDGFDPRQGVVLLAATNRPEILDPALLRAGRFNRHVLVDRPDKAGRVQILQVHLRGVLYDATVDLDQLAAQTPGFTGADLANLVNEGTLLAARRNAERVSMSDFMQAIERLIAGLEKKNRILNRHERKVVAYHEAGHALVSLLTPGSDPIQKVSIIPRGIGALGYTMQRPLEDRFLMSEQELESKLSVLFGGRAAESLVFSDVSTGAADDISKATEIARNMVTRYGMNNELGLVAYESDNGSFLYGPGSQITENHRFSEHTAREIDCAVKTLVEAAFKRASRLLTDNRELLEAMAKQLLARETLSKDDLTKIVGSVLKKNGKNTDSVPATTQELSPTSI